MVVITDGNSAVPEAKNTHTKEVQTLWYRAVEVLFEYTPHKPSIDNWSLGCCIYFMATGETLFGEDLTEVGTILQIFRFTHHVVLSHPSKVVDGLQFAWKSY